MNENKFIEKFQNKNDSELKYIIENKKSYNEQAVSASIEILKKRNGESSELKEIEKEIKAEKEIKKVIQRKAVDEYKIKNNITDDPNAPELHSRKVIMVFSGLFSTIFGAVLLMYNLKQTENKTGRIQVLIFGVLYTILTLVIVNLINVGGNIAIIFNIVGGGILTEYFWNKFIGKDFEHRKRNWIKPAIISILITIPLILATIYGQ